MAKSSRSTPATQPQLSLVPVEPLVAKVSARVMEEVAKQAPAAPARRATAETMAQKQREISISEFFTKNRHLLGFDNPSKALLTTVKEAVDNSLDACEEAGILPEIEVEISELGGDRYRVAVEDNGPGIVKEQISKVFGKLLYGSKFHRLKQSRGQQGIGISAAVMYGQLTTGKAARVLSRTSAKSPAHEFMIRIDTRKNAPDETERVVPWAPKGADGQAVEKQHGTRVEIEMTANFVNGQRSVLRYLEQTALANPHAIIRYIRPKQPVLEFPRSSSAC
jgi:DNA topoisomerase-6 subunit B